MFQCWVNVSNILCYAGYEMKKKDSSDGVRMYENKFPEYRHPELKQFISKNLMNYLKNLSSLNTICPKGNY